MKPIDFVIPWVDGSDPEWIAIKNEYLGNKGDKSEVRFRDWDTLRFLFRGIECFAPWVNNVFFLTHGHIPSWLNTNNPKLKIIKHSDYIPSEYLPTFSSHTIELNMHRIPELSENFVYFNDDFFIINPTNPTDFFKEDLPCDMSVLYPGYACEDSFFNHIMLNDAEFFQRHFDIKEVVKNNFSKYFYLPYGKNLIKTFTMNLYPEFTGFVLHHQPQSFNKSILEKVWELEPSLLHNTCLHHFRTSDDINQYIFRYYQLGTGEYAPYNIFKRGDYIAIGNNNIDYDNVINSNRKKILVLNDCGDKLDFETEKSKLLLAFNKKFPNKSDFELD